MAGAWTGPCSTFIMTGWAQDPPEQALLKGREHLARSKGGNETSQDKTLQSHREEEDNFTTNLGLNLLKMHVHPLHLVV